MCPLCVSVSPLCKCVCVPCVWVPSVCMSPVAQAILAQEPFSAKTFVIRLCFSREGCSHISCACCVLPVICGKLCVCTLKQFQRRHSPFQQRCFACQIRLQQRPLIQCPILPRQRSSVRLTKTALSHRRTTVFGCYHRTLREDGSVYRGVLPGDYRWRRYAG